MIALALSIEEELAALKAKTVNDFIYGCWTEVLSEAWTFGSPEINVRCSVRSRRIRGVTTREARWTANGKRIGYNALLGKIAGRA